MEVPDFDIADVPQNKRHGATRTGCAHKGALCLVPLIEVPNLTVAVNSTSAIPVNPDVVSGQYEASCMVLELDVIGVIAPVIQIFGKLPPCNISLFIRSLSFDFPHGET